VRKAFKVPKTLNDTAQKIYCIIITERDIFVEKARWTVNRALLGTKIVGLKEVDEPRGSEDNSSVRVCETAGMIFK